MERPLECTNCRKPVLVRYTQIIGSQVKHMWMCEGCPYLEKLIEGTSPKKIENSTSFKGTDVACAQCATTLDEVRSGSALGCSECYSIFGDFLEEELLKSNQISSYFTSNKQTSALHVGRALGESKEKNPILKLITLNEALDEMLIREDYEQAALLRDQIKELKQKVHRDKEQT